IGPPMIPIRPPTSAPRPAPQSFDSTNFTFASGLTSRPPRRGGEPTAPLPAARPAERERLAAARVTSGEFGYGSGERRRQAMKVKDVMTADVRTVGPETLLRDVAAILAEHRISGLPVVDSERRVLGVVSSADILLKERAEAPAPERGGILGRLRRGNDSE